MIENKDGPIKETSKLSKWILKYASIIFLALAIFIAAFWGWDLYQTIINVNNMSLFSLIFSIIITGFFIWISVVLFRLGIYSWIKECAKYTFREDGIFVEYPFNKKELVSWDEFQELCICYTGYTTRGEERAVSVICFVKKGAKKNSYGRWPADNPFRYKEIISVEYTEEKLKEIQRICPYEIVDLRKTRTYRLL